MAEFKVGDQVVHATYGPGEIIRLDEKELSGHKALYYVVQVHDLTLWVPVENAVKTSLRLLTPSAEFEKLFAILCSPGEPLSTNRLERKTQLVDTMKDGRLESICRVIRDLTYYQHTKKLSESDSIILDRARTFFLAEWALARSITVAQAGQELARLLDKML